MVDVFIAKGRVGDDEVELLAGVGQLMKRDEGVLDPDVEGLVLQFRGVEILFDELRVLVGLFHADGAGCAAAEAFETERAGAAEQL